VAISFKRDEPGSGPAGTAPAGGAGPSGDAAQGIAALQPMLLRLARLQLRNEAWAEDAVAETLLAAVEGLRTFDQRSQLRTWVVGILKHKIIDQFRRGSREVSLEAEEELRDGDDLGELFQADGHRVSQPSAWGDPEQSLARVEFFTVLQACLDQLPAPLARAFLLREWMDFTTADICKELQVTSTNCFVMLYRARMRLRECLETRWFAGDGSKDHG
jgi:RNA polymerase sigma-70 factor (ECF subfamily)